MQEKNIIYPCSTIVSSEASELYKNLLKTGINNDFLEIKESKIKGGGLGVFAKKNFEKDDIIERCHLIVLGWRLSYPYPPEIIKYGYSLSCDCEECKKYGKKIALPLGYGCIYNTSIKQEDSNAWVYLNIHTPVQIFVCSKPIKNGEEILVYYGEGYVNSMVNNNI